MSYSKLVKYLTEPFFVFHSAPKFKPAWKQEFDHTLIIQKQKRLKIAAYISILLSVFISFLGLFFRVLLKSTISTSLVLPNYIFYIVATSHCILLFTALFYILYIDQKALKLKSNLSYYAYLVGIASFFIVMFVVLWIYTGNNNPFMGSLFAYIILIYYPNRLSLYSYVTYCTLYCIFIFTFPQSFAYSFNAFFSGVVSSIIAYFVGETVFEWQIKEFFNRKHLEQKGMELSCAYDDIYRLNSLLNSENQRMGSELNIAQELQSIILPKLAELKTIDYLDIAATMSPATEVGGDYYDFLVNEDNHKVTIAIADVTGHGLESGIFTIMIQTAVRIIDNLDNYPIRESLQVINKVLFDNAQRMQSDKSLTFLLIKYDRGRIEICGQHEEVILVRQNGDFITIDTFDLGFPIGLEANIFEHLRCKELLLESGDSLILYTDGVTEAVNKFNEFYGNDRLYQVIKKNYSRSAEEMRQNIIDDLMEFIGIARIYDDITLLVIKQK